MIDSSEALDFELQKSSRKLNFGIWTSNIAWKQKVISSPKVGNILVLDTSLYLDTIIVLWVRGNYTPRTALWGRSLKLHIVSPHIIWNAKTKKHTFLRMYK